MKSLPAVLALSLVATAIGVDSADAQTLFTEQGATILGGVNYDSRSASLADIDRDGDLDLFFQGGGGGAGARQLFRNNKIGTGSMTFTNITASIPGADLGPSWSAAWGDYDGDHKIDVFVGQSNIDATGDVLRNIGSNTFSNESVATGLNDPGFHQNVAWADIDDDRDLDLVIGMEGPEMHEIYLQGPGHTFTPVGASVGFQAPFGTKSYGMALGDTDGDGDLDVYISTCAVGANIRNNFFKNMLKETGSLSFVDIADSNGTQDMENTYHAEFQDFDDDGDLDLFVAGADKYPSKIFRNNGGNMFTDVDTLTGHALISNVGGDLNGGKAVDYDNDGDLDLFFHDHLAASGTNSSRRLYRNDGNWTFTDVTSSVGLSASNQGAYDSAWGDIDLDGDQDLIAPTDLATSGGRNPNEKIYVSSASTNGNHWLYVRLNGPTDNTTGIGAELFATINAGTPQERTLRRDANTSAGTFNQSDLPVHFGLGAAALIDQLVIKWRDGTIQTLHDVAVDRYLSINVSGDFNGDGVVDAADLAQWKGDAGLNADSEANYDGFTDGADLLAWQQHVGNGAAFAATATQSVPEPAAAALAFVALATAFSLKHSKSYGHVPFRRRRG